MFKLVTVNTSMRALGKDDGTVNDVPITGNCIQKSTYAQYPQVVSYVRHDTFSS